MADCPEFWRNRSIKINLMNLKDEGYLKNLKISAFIAIGFDLIVGISSIVLVWKFSMREAYSFLCERSNFNSYDDKLGPWLLFGLSLGPFSPFTGFGKFKFILTKIILFAMPLIDTCTGKGNNSDPTIYGGYSSIKQKAFEGGQSRSS